MQAFWLTLADKEFYFPLDRVSDVGETYAPSKIPDGWSGTVDGTWTYWRPAEPVLVDEGWKVHVSTRPERLRFTLDTVAAVCFDEGLVFKHLSAQLFYEVFHHKHVDRAQAGKFIAIYPPEVATARRLMERLTAELKGETGPYVLTDRRYADSGVVQYRYGAHRSRSRIQADGTTLQLVRDGQGRDVPDVRSAQFVLPAGVEDPFATPEPPHTGPILLNGRYEVTGVIRHSNGGGTYRATDTRTGRTVFVKEARAYNGFMGDGTDSRGRLRHEWETLERVHSLAPGLCPEPLDHFTEWEHDFLVTEFVEGAGFVQWVAAHTVMGRFDVDPARHTEYLARVDRVLASLRAAIDRLHGIGLRFGDLSHGNVVVLDDLGVRLIDFETANPLDEKPSALGTPGYKPTPAQAAAGVEDDEYGFSGLAQFALFPLTQQLVRDPVGRTELYRRDLEHVVPVPAELWRTVTRFHPGTAAAGAPAPVHDLPSAASLDADPERELERLRAGLTAGLLAMARPDGRDWVFPPPPRGYAVNTHCLEHGTAGVLHALLRSGAGVPDELVARFRRDALKNAAVLAPGLQNGTAGIAWVLAELGLGDEAGQVLDTAPGHPLSLASAQLAHGAAGIGLTHVALHERLGGDRRLAFAAGIADAFVAEDPRRLLSGAGAPGLASGLAGTALFLQTIGTYTGEQRYLRGAVALMHAELDRAADGGADGLMFRDTTQSRILPYLAEGSAGVALALTRLAATTGDERCVRTLPQVVAMCRLTCTVDPGLHTGLAGPVYALAEYADYAERAEPAGHVGGPGERATALRVATGLAKYAIRHPDGLRVLGAAEERFHADLGSGSAGVLLALARVLDGPGAPLLPEPGTP
ncbi:class III lanthionine synthetase LanKC [Streptomyces sp. NPDC060198]|uniref:class III lanthionine synthetase LanKC n=1 Tax=Streptomyces sp. NPDC060198 TaxID=3347070 RepID=UPI0036567B8F